MPWQTTKILKSRVAEHEPTMPDPSESSVHGKEIHVAKQQQTQKEVSTTEVTILTEAKLITYLLLTFI